MLLNAQTWLRQVGLVYAPVVRGQRVGIVVKFAGAVIALGLTLQAVFVESFYIASASMAPTLKAHDSIVVPKFAYGLQLPIVEKRVLSWATPVRGEVVVFHRDDDPTTVRDESERIMVKRIIGLGGDRVQIVNQSVVVNGISLHEPYARWIGEGVRWQQSFVVPMGKAFLLGDNRNDSYDSRFWRDPFVSLERVIGPVAGVYWSSSSERSR